MFDRHELQLRPQSQRFEPNASCAGTQIPKHSLLRWIEIGQQLDANFPFGHQTWVVAVLQVRPIIEAKEGIGLWILWRWFLGDQHRNQKPMQIEGEIVIRCDLLNAFFRVTEVFA